MKFGTFKTKHALRRRELDKSTPIALESFTKPSGGSHQAHSYGELRQQIHNDLRTQHPEWIQPNGECPLCDSYEARLMELLGISTREGSTESVVTPHCDPEHGLN